MQNRKKPKNNFNFLMDDFIQPMPSKRYFVNELSSKQYVINIVGEITEPEDYLEELQILDTASEMDDVVIRLSTPGGLAETSNLIVTSMRNCAANITVLVNEVASAGTQIMLAADSWQTTPYSMMMIHNASLGAGFQKIKDLKAYADFEDKQCESWVEYTYKGFLTDDEIKEVIHGKELYFDHKQIGDRLQNYIKWREEKEQEMIEEINQKKNDEETEEVEFDESDPSTWPEETKVILTSAINGFRKGTEAVIIGYVEGQLGDLIELATKDSGYLVVTPEQYGKLKFVEQ